MVGVQSLVSLLLASSALAAPAHISIPPYTWPWKTELCNLSPLVKKVLCPRQQASNPTTVSTPIGTAQGTADDAGAARFAVRYASAARWQLPQLATAWELP